MKFILEERRLPVQAKVIYEIEIDVKGKNFYYIGKSQNLKSRFGLRLKTPTDSVMVFMKEHNVSEAKVRILEVVQHCFSGVNINARERLCINYYNENFNIINKLIPRLRGDENWKNFENSVTSVFKRTKKIKGK